MNWKNITLWHYQQIEEINAKDLSEVDKALYCTCIVFDKTEHELDNMDLKKVLKMAKTLQTIFETPFNPGNKNRLGKYVITYDVSKITLGQYIELAFFFSHGVVKNAHYILATMSHVWMRRHTTVDHRRKAEYYSTQPVELIVGAVNLIKDNYDRFNNEYRTLFGVDPSVSPSANNDEFNKRYGWIFSATQIAQHEGITLDKAFELPIRQAFNDLIFLKAKSKYEIEQIRNSHKSIA